MNIPKYENRISTITQIALPQPDMSCRRNRSPKIVISNQNHSTKINIEKTSARKLGNVKPPGNNMLVLRLQDQVPDTCRELNLQFLQTRHGLLQAPPAKPLPCSHRTSFAALSRRRHAMRRSPCRSLSCGSAKTEPRCGIASFSPPALGSRQLYRDRPADPQARRTQHRLRHRPAAS